MFVGFACANWACGALTQCNAGCMKCCVTQRRAFCEPSQLSIHGQNKKSTSDQLRACVGHIWLLYLYLIHPSCVSLRNAPQQWCQFTAAEAAAKCCCAPPNANTRCSQLHATPAAATPTPLQQLCLIIINKQHPTTTCSTSTAGQRLPCCGIWTTSDQATPDCCQQCANSREC